MIEGRGRLLHLTRYYQSLDPMDGFASKETWLANSPSLRDDIFDKSDFESFDVDVIVLEGGVKPTGLLDDWRIPADLPIDFVESGGVVVALDVDTGRLRSVEDRADTRFFGARVEAEGTIPYISGGIGSVFDLDPGDMLVSPGRPKLGTVQHQRRVEASDPLAGHVREGRRFASPLAATGNLQIGDWVQDDLPDLLSPVLTLSEFGTSSARNLRTLAASCTRRPRRGGRARPRRSRCRWSPHKFGPADRACP